MSEVVMEYQTGVEGSIGCEAVFDKEKLMKIVNEWWGITDLEEFISSYIWDDTKSIMEEFDRRNWDYETKEVPF